MFEHANLYKVINIMKSVALTADKQLKTTWQDVKFHQVDAAVSFAVLDYYKSGQNLALLFGELDEKTIEQLVAFLSSKVEDMGKASNDQTLNAAVFGGPALNRFDAYFPPQVLSEESLIFHGKIVIRSSFGEDIKEGTLVNIALRLNDDSAQTITLSAKSTIEASPVLSDASVGRLTSTNDLTERHVSLGLRMPYTEALRMLVEEINAAGDFSGLTSGKLRIVVPPDIRAEFSAVSLVDEPTIARLQSLQERITSAAGAEGNKLPPLHITQANKPIEINSPRLVDFINLTKINGYLNAYNLDILRTKEISDTTQPGPSSIFSHITDGAKIVEASTTMPSTPGASRSLQ